ncbi:MAG: hypothetical protein K2R98_19950 [Gemmataceae bacterium]|nr:hypothetical protein [Gemmataceae bacterium]
MRHPFDGIIAPESTETAQVRPTRRAALEKMLVATAGLLGFNSAARADKEVSTDALNEEGARATTRAVGEEGGQPIEVTKALNENGAKPTTLAIGEEGGMTQARGEAGNPGLTTEAKNEEGGMAPMPPASQDVKPEQLKAAWTDLGSSDATKQYQGLMTIYSAKQGVPFIKDNLKAEVMQIDAQRVAQLIKDLDNDAFMMREKATTDLVKMGPGILPLLEKEMGNAASVEVRMRLGMIGDKIRLLPAVQQAQRALDVLVFLGTPEAKGVLENLAKGNAEAWLTPLAKNAVGRMGVGPKPGPGGIGVPVPLPVPVPQPAPRPLPDR